MINIIVGENSTGKTLMLRKMYRENREVSVASFADNYRRENTKLNIDDLYDVSQALQITDVVKDDYRIKSARIAYPNTLPCECSEELIAVLNTLCKNVAKVYLDEPEFYLTEIDCVRLKVALLFLEKDVWLTTHCRTLIHDDFRYYTIHNGVMKEATWEVSHECTV